MIKLNCKLDRQVYVATSGGVDSMAVLSFLKRNHNVTAIHFNHGNDYAAKEQAFVEQTCEQYNIPLIVGHIDCVKDSSESLEEYWRNQRYKFFHSFDFDIITCHHLDDCVETWIWSSLHGNSKTIPFRNKNVIRPFLLNRKSDFVNWCNTKQVEWIEDDSNTDVKFTRNFIRHELVPKALVVNPGLHKTVAKKIRQSIQ